MDLLTRLLPLAAILTLSFNTSAAIGDIISVSYKDAIRTTTEKCSWVETSGYFYARLIGTEEFICTSDYTVSTSPGEVYSVAFNYGNKGGWADHFATNVVIRMIYLDASGVEQYEDITVDPTQWTYGLGPVIGNYANLIRVSVRAVQYNAKTSSENLYLTVVDLPADNPDALEPPAPVTPTISPNVGEVSWFYNSFAAELSGYIPVMGQWITKDDYPELVYVVAEGDESVEQIQLRDCRGEFIRAKDLGRGVDAGRDGEHQGDELKSHNHNIVHAGYGGSGAFGFESGTGSYVHPTEYTGGSETRPRNIDYVCAIYPGQPAVTPQ
ncbi:hypothetical protein [Thalassomonas sp. RHCl1]|uniref:hypothetical protein n=1 Tax=Thalassomonas sp. RHCl1 TaxID=2995320 RepID=UPI00248BCECF|nr:hypothetical protein [Thalassomonas sp. RHCl1]